MANLYDDTTHAAGVAHHRLSVNSWGSPKWKHEWSGVKLLHFTLNNYVEDTITETWEIAVSISIAFQDLDLVVNAFGKAVSVRAVE